MELRRIDPEQTQPLGAAAQGVAVNHIGAWTIDHGDHLGVMPPGP
jgi:hypothetical protein